MAFRHEVLHIRRQQQRLIDIPGAKILAHSPSLNQTRSELNSDYSDRLLGVFLVALEKLDRDALRPADEADAHPRPDRRRLPGELDAFGPDLGGHRIDVLHRQPEMIEP